MRVDPGLRPRGRQVDRFTGTQPRRCTTPHMDSVRISAWYLPIIEFSGVVTTAAIVGVGGWLVHRRRRHDRHRHVLRAHAVEPVRAGAAAVAAVQHRAVGRRRRSTSSTGCSTPTPTSPSGRARSNSRPAATIVVDHVSFRYADDEPWVLARCRRSRSRRASASRSSVRPARASRRWPRSSPASTTRERRGDLRRRRPARRARSSRCAGASCVVPQEGFLFNGTIRDNVRIARAGATDAEVDDALRRRRRARPVRARCPKGSTPRCASAGRGSSARGEAARVARPGRARRSRGPRARRGDVVARSGHRAARRARPSSG